MTGAGGAGEHPGPYAYGNRRGVRPVSWADFTGLCKGLALAVAGFAPDVVVGVARGGLYPATQLAHLLRRDLVPVYLSRRVGDRVAHDDPRWIVRPVLPPDRRRVLVVDEICDTGRTLSLAREEVARLTGAVVRTCVLYAHPPFAHVPDHIGLITDELVVNPWDREALVDGRFVVNPEYVSALAAQGADASVLPGEPVAPVRPVR